jgi:endogenous inhibitor of DNA gyrase (YacG/DUF329 family)
MILGRCPTCSRSYEIADLAELPSFPFCSNRCRLIDLGRWADERYVIAGPPAGAAMRPREKDQPDDDSI